MDWCLRSVRAAGGRGCRVVMIKRLMRELPAMRVIKRRWRWRLRRRRRRRGSRCRQPLQVHLEDRSMKLSR